MRCGLGTLRSTIHLHTATDALELRALTQPVLERVARGQFRKLLEGVDADAAARLVRELVATKPRTRAELRAALAERFPGVDDEALVLTANFKVPLVQVPPRAVWGQAGQPRWAPLEQWLGGPLPANPDPAPLVRRYLASYGPASAKDFQSWSGLTRDAGRCSTRSAASCGRSPPRTGPCSSTSPTAPCPTRDPGPGSVSARVRQRDPRLRRPFADHPAGRPPLAKVGDGAVLVDGFVAAVGVRSGPRS